MKDDIKIIELGGILELNHPTGAYISEALLCCQKLAEAFIKDCDLTKRRITLWCTGSSGAIMATLFYSELAKHGANLSSRVRINHIPKSGERTHGRANFYQKEDLHIIIDDFMSTGATIKYILQEMYDLAWCYAEDLIIDYVIMTGVKDYIDFSRCHVKTFISDVVSYELKEKIEKLNKINVY